MQSSGAAGSSERGLLLALGVCGVDMLLMGSAVLMSNSLTILSDFFKESSDFLAVLASYLAVRAVRRNTSERFGYGIGKLENLVSMGIALLMVGCALFIVAHAVAYVKEPRAAEGTLPGLVIFTVYAAIGCFIWYRNRLLWRKEPSPVVESQMRMWFSKFVFDAVMALTLTAAMVFHGQAWSLYLDPLASLIGAALLLHGAWAITSSSVDDLLDATLEENLQILILKHLVDHFDDYQHLHKVRARRSGPNLYVEIFLQFDPELLMGEVQRRIDVIRREINQSLPGAEVALVPTLVAPVR
ncbi:MAG TPA: cation diffusion facilitator family transporter [Ramlibacter sp.]|nr:cation diffusion facilitator family transporter [Ramlibacter sp.]